MNRKLAKSVPNPDPVSAHSADSISLHSKLDGEISNLDRIERSLLFAEISMLSYLAESEVRILAADLGFTDVTYIDREGAQTYILQNGTDKVVACRGTEPNEWNDVQADANAFTDLAETTGRVHRGFKREVDTLWPLISENLDDDGTVLWFCGHSLGGAMATICAARCELADIEAHPHQVYTYGSPRVGTRSYVQNVVLDHVRWVNNNDIVTRVPPTWMGYRHTGRLMYLNAYGKIRKLTPRQRAKDRWRGFRAGLRAGSFDHFSDHAVVGYVKFIEESLSSRR